MLRSTLQDSSILPPYEIRVTACKIIPLQKHPFRSQSPPHHFPHHRPAHRMMTLGRILTNSLPLPLPPLLPLPLCYYAQILSHLLHQILLRHLHPLLYYQF